MVFTRIKQTEILNEFCVQLKSSVYWHSTRLKCHVLETLSAKLVLYYENANTFRTTSFCEVFFQSCLTDKLPPNSQVLVVVIFHLLEKHFPVFHPSHILSHLIHTVGVINHTLCISRQEQERLKCSQFSQLLTINIKTLINFFLFRAQNLNPYSHFFPEFI